jgi:ribosome-associated translation inhibitor RaiA
MRIEVLGHDTISAQARTYAEYRLFAELSRVVDTNRIRQARLVLRRRKDDPDDESVSCTVTVDIEGGERLRIQSSAAHPYAAINRVVERLAETSWPPRVGGPPGPSSFHTDRDVSS